MRATVAVPAVVWIVTLTGVALVGDADTVGEVQLIPYCDGSTLDTVSPLITPVTLEQTNVTVVVPALGGCGGADPETVVDAPGDTDTVLGLTITDSVAEPTFPELSVAVRTILYVICVLRLGYVCAFGPFTADSRSPPSPQSILMVMG